jgi:phage protein D/phage baseplate assembly protein gpV
MNQSFYAPRFDVRISGITMAADLTSQVISVTYESSLDTADMFAIVLRNHDNQFTDMPLFNPGANVELYMGYGDDLAPMMLGEITSVSPKFPESGAPTIAISGYDKSYKMRHNEPIPREFRYMTDSMIVAQIALENLLIPVVDPSPWFHIHKTQTGKDFAFLKDLATENLFDIYVYWDKLYFQFPRQTEAIVLEWGQSLKSFSPRLSTATMAGLQIIRGYNEALAQAVIGIATGALLNLDDIVERLGPQAIEMLATLGRRLIHKQSITSPIDAIGFAKSLLQELIDGLYEGTGSCIGIPELRAGRFIRIAGVGKRFSGNYRLRKVTHTIDDDGYSTDFEISQGSGSSILSFIRNVTDVELNSPSNRAEKFYGVAIAEVTQAPQISPEPDLASKLGARVKVKFPWLSDSNESSWARVLTPSAGGDRGIYFMPEPGDHVIVAFQDGELSMPIVLGSVWDGPMHPPVYPPLPPNAVRMIKSKSGHSITMDDTTGLEKMTIHHKSGSEIAMDNLGNISVNANMDLSLKANGNIKLTAANVAISVTGAVNIT